MNNEHHGKDFLVGAMVGSTLGAITALMFSTKKGHKIQHQLVDKYHDFEKALRHYTHGKTRQAKRMAKRTIKKAKRKAKRVVRKVKKIKRRR